MTKQQIPQEDEVDLGSLFKIIGKGFQNLFSAIGKFFISVGHYFILWLLFLKNNALKLGLSTLIGAGIGLYLDFTQQKTYSSSMIVVPNFKSTHQLYQNIDFYHELVKQRNFGLLAETFDIPTNEAITLRGFYVEPIQNENEQYEFYDQFIEEIDTATLRKINIDLFKKAFTDYDYKYHKIEIKSKNNTIFEKLSEPIISSIENNPYFENQKSLNDKNLLQNEKVLLKSLEEVDTLRKIYNEVLITEARKAEIGTNISLAQGVNKTNELELFEKSLELNEELLDNNEEKVEKAEVMNVISSFSKVGIREKGILSKKTFTIGVLFGLIMMIFILLRQLNSYLITYKK